MLVGLCVLLGVGGPALAADDDAKAQQVLQYAGRSLVALHLVISDPAGNEHTRDRTGVVVDARRRLIVTTYDVAAPDAQNFLKKKVLAVFPQLSGGKLVMAVKPYQQQLDAGKAAQAKVIAGDAKRYLAVLQVEELPKGVRAIHMSFARTGQPVYAVGSAYPRLHYDGRQQQMWSANAEQVDNVMSHKWQYKMQDRRLRVQPQDRSARVLITRHRTVHVVLSQMGGAVVNERGQLLGIRTWPDRALAQGGRGVAPPMAIDVREVRALLASKQVKDALKPASK